MKLPCRFPHEKCKTQHVRNSSGENVAPTGRQPEGGETVPFVDCAHKPVSSE